MKKKDVYHLARATTLNIDGRESLHGPKVACL